MKKGPFFPLPFYRGKEGKGSRRASTIFHPPSLIRAAVGQKSLGKEDFGSKSGFPICQTTVVDKLSFPFLVRFFTAVQLRDWLYNGKIFQKFLKTYWTEVSFLLIFIKEILGIS